MYLDFNTTITNMKNHFDSLVSMANNNYISLFFAPTLPTILPLSTLFKDTQVGWCAQDCSAYTSGAYTGQISAETIKSIGCTMCLVGHSERRIYCGDTDEIVAQKLQSLLALNISPVICIGECEEDMRQKKTIATLERQLNFIIIKLAEHKNTFHELPIYIAYEPVWSIGTEKIADHLHIQNTYTWLKNYLSNNIASIKVNLLYGGSVNSGSIEYLKKFNLIDGFLIGRASLHFQEFEKIVKCIIVE
jgi:triosephosphate isomerase